MAAERRKSPRFDLPDGIRVLDDAGVAVGKVRRAGGGGMEIAVADGYAPPDMVGRPLSLTVVTAEGEKRRMRVEVCYFQGRVMGVRFLQTKAAAAG